MTASENRCNDVLVTWFDVPDETGYIVMRNGVQVSAFLAPNTTSYSDVTAVQGTTYSYAVASFNAGCGSLSLPDSGRRVLPLGPVTAVSASDTSCTQVLVAWSNSLFPDSFQIRRNGVRIGSTPAITSFFFDVTAVPGVTYTYRIVGYNSCGAGDTTGSDQGTRLAVPSAVTSVSATDSLCNSVQITWSYPAGPYTFQIRRAGVALAQVGPGVYTYTDMMCVPGVSRLYCVVAYNQCGAGDTSGCDLGMCLTAPQQAPNPIVPDSCASFNICWASVPDAGGYTIRRSGNLIDSVSAGTLCYSDSAAPQQHQLTVAAFNACGEGPQSPPITVGFSVLPTISNLAASDSLCDQVSLTWTFTLQVDSFLVYRNDTLIGRSALPAFTDLTAVPYTVYSYAVYGHNACGTGPRSAPDNGASWHVPAQVSGVNATSSRCDSVIITWQNVANETLYRIFRDGTEAGTAAANVTRFADVPAAGTFSYTVRAENGCGAGALSGPQSGTRLAAPGAPSNVTASDNLCGEVVIWWSGATGDVDSLRFYRNGVLIGSTVPSAESFVDASAAGAYSYTVRALSLECGEGPASLPDSGRGHIAAGQPSALSVITPATCDSIRLTWQSGGGEIEGFLVRRDGIIVDTTIAPNYTDHAVDDALSHTYDVAAYNSFCGASGFCDPVSGSQRKLVELLSDLPEVLPCSVDVVLQLEHCSGVERDSFYLSLDGGPYVAVGGAVPPGSEEIVPIRNSGPFRPDSRLMIVSQRGARRDTVVSDPFAVDSCALSADDVAGAIPSDFFLDQNFPNPFNPKTTLRFGVPREADVTIEVFDVLGRRAGNIIHGTYRPGVYTVVWDCSACPTGMYLVRLLAADRVLLRKILLMK